MLQDVSACSLRNVQRCNKLFKWFFARPNRSTVRKEERILHSIILALAHCYFYRLNGLQNNRYAMEITRLVRTKIGIKVDFSRIIQTEQLEYLRNVKIPPGIAKNHNLTENLFVMLVALATKTPTIIVGKPGSSKTLAMDILQDNLSSATKNEKLTKLGFDDYFFVSLQCSKFTTASLIEKRWEFAEQMQRKQKFRSCFLHPPPAFSTPKCLLLRIASPE